MRVELSAFNIELLIPSEILTNYIRPVTNLAIFEKQSRNFHPEGLFSTEIFGKIATEERNERFSYIDLNVNIFHPVIYKSLASLKKLYVGIMSGKDYAIWDSKKKDFVPATIADGKTGFAFFIKHFKELKFEERPSDSREFNIKLIYKYLNKGMFNKLLILPAGLRDYEIDSTGKPSEDEINSLYRKVLATANLLDKNTVEANIEVLDSTIFKLQKAVVEIYEYFRKMLDGKKKFIQGKWAKRAVFNGTRNVITSLPIVAPSINAPTLVGFNQTVVGLYQYSKAILPITIFKLKNSFISRVFTEQGSIAKLVNKETLKLEEVTIDTSYRDMWMSNEGLEQTLNKFSQEELRHLPIEVEGYYMGLIYIGPDKTFKLLQNIDELPEDRDRKYVKPLTFAELIYISLYKSVSKYPCIVTRYPVTGLGSIYPSEVYLKTTNKGLVLTELDELWNKTNFIANEFPKPGESFFNSLSPHYSRLGRLGADFDGDPVFS
jgi:hypothetical protein